MFNTFDTGVVTALRGAVAAYLRRLGGPTDVPVLEQAQTEPQAASSVTVSATESEEMVLGSGHMRVGLDVMLRVDQDTGSPELLRDLSQAVADALQQDDLVAQLTAYRDETDRPVCVVQGIFPGTSRLEDIGDRQWRRVYTLEVFGFSPGGS